MADTSAHLVDRVLPRIPYRQFTLSFPRRVRFALARDGRLLGQVLRAYLAVVFAWQRRRARQLTGGTPIVGAVTAIQRAGGMANLNVHFHSVIPDGVFVASSVFDASADAPPAFLAIAPPTDDEVEALLVRIGRRVEALLARFAAKEEETGEFEPDALTYAESEAVMTPGLPCARSADSEPRPKSRCAFISGYSLHADVTVHQNDRLGLERLSRYILRPPLARDRLSRNHDGQVRYRFRRPDSAGRTEIVLAPETFLSRLATLIPPPRQNQLRYHGCFAPRSKLRAAIVPRVAEDTRHSRSRLPPGTRPGHRRESRSSGPAWRSPDPGGAVALDRPATARIGRVHPLPGFDPADPSQHLSPDLTRSWAAAAPATELCRRTSELAIALAGEQHSLYSFEGLKRHWNENLHISSHRFDEPQALALVQSAEYVLSLHGCNGAASVAYVGGLNGALAAQIRQHVVQSGFRCEPAKQGLAAYSYAQEAIVGAHRSMPARTPSRCRA